MNQMTARSGFKNSHLYVLSGTGNTFRVGCWMKEHLESAGTNVTMEMIEDANPAEDVKPHKDTLVGLLFPAHGFLPPWSMIKFIFSFPSRRGATAFCTATRGSVVCGPLQVPGASGFATFLAAFILFLKGYRVKGIFSLDMPSNFINMHWGLHSKNADKILNKAMQRTIGRMTKLIDGKRIWFTLNNLWESLWAGVLFWLVPVFPLIYLLFGKLFMAKMMFSNNSCVGCGLCSKSCPNNGIKMVSVAGKKYPFWTLHCENCMRCMGYCNHKAVEAGHSWGFILWYITSVPVVFWISVWIHEHYSWVPKINNYWLNELLSGFYFIPAVIIAYRLFWFAIRLKPINTLFTYTTLTRFYRRYREPETRLKRLILMAKKKKN